MKWGITVVILFFCILTPCICLADPRDEGAKNPPVNIGVPAGYTAKKVLLFPLDLPMFTIKALTWPIGTAVKYLDKTGIIEGALELMSNKDHTLWVYPIIEGGAGTGFGGGLGVSDSDLFHKGYNTGATYRIHINMDQRATFYFGKPDAFKINNVPVSYKLDVDWGRITSDDYYGMGNGSSQSNHTIFGDDDVEVNFIVPFSVLDKLSLVPIIGFSANDTRGGMNGSYPNVNDVFSGQSASGYGTGINYFKGGLKLINNTTDDPNDPSTGGVREFSFARYQGVNTGGFDYNNFGVDIRQYFRLWRERQVLVLHAGFQFEQVTGSNSVPFMKLATLDNTSPLRGFSRGRFKDWSSEVFNVEYRFPVWQLINGVIFYDTGRVFHGLESISLDSIKYSIGGGINFKIPDIALFRFEAAYGGEGVNIMFGTSRSL